MLSVGFNENHFACTSTECLYADTTDTGIEVQKGRPFCLTVENAEEGLFDLVGGGANPNIGRGVQPAPFHFAGYNSHEIYL